MPLVVLDSRRLAAEELVAVPPVFGGMDGHDHFPVRAFLDPNGGVRGQPIVGVNDVETADAVFHAVEALDERAAHVVDFVDETRIQGETAAMIMHAVDFIVFLLSRPDAGEDVNFMSPALHGRGKFGDVDANSAHGNRVKCFPREHCYPHEYIAPFHA